MSRDDEGLVVPKLILPGPTKHIMTSVADSVKPASGMHSHVANFHVANGIHEAHCVLAKGNFARQSFWNVHCSCLFSALPDELLLFSIFVFLDIREVSTIARVSTRWRFLATDRLLWQRADLSSYSSLIGDATLASMLDRFGPFLRSLKLCNCHRLSAQSLTMLGKARHIRELHLCNLKAVDDTILDTIAANCPSLKHVSLFGCTKLTDASVSRLTSACTDLEEVSLRNVPHISSRSIESLGAALRGLNVAGCRRMDRQSAVVLAERCPRLERLNLHGARLDDAAVEALVTGCPRLSTLHLSSANPFGGSSLLTDASVRSLARLDDLRCLNLQGSSNISDDAVGQLVRVCTGLERLNLGGCYRITDRGAWLISRHAQRLSHLSMFQLLRLTDLGLGELLRHLPRLGELDVHGCMAVTGASLRLLACTRTDPDPAPAQADELFAAAGAADETRQAWPKLEPFEPAAADVRAFKYALQLSKLDISGCRGIAPADALALRAVRPGVSVHH